VCSTVLILLSQIPLNSTNPYSVIAEEKVDVFNLLSGEKYYQGRACSKRMWLGYKHDTPSSGRGSRMEKLLDGRCLGRTTRATRSYIWLQQRGTKRRQHLSITYRSISIKRSNARVHRSFPVFIQAPTHGGAGKISWRVPVEQSSGRLGEIFLKDMEACSHGLSSDRMMSERYQPGRCDYPAIP
jgi:hypothetical protein